MQFHTLFCAVFVTVLYITRLLSAIPYPNFDSTHQMSQTFRRKCSSLLKLSSGDCSDTTRFLILGDWGGIPYSPFFTKVQTTIAARMGDVAAQYDYQFVLALGDNFYFDGVNDVTDPRFKETYEDVFTSESLQRPWFIVAGNHDHHANVTAQIDYSKKSKRWRFPDLNYTFAVPLGSSPQQTVRFIMIDTVQLCGLNDRDYEGQAPPGPDDPLKAESTFAWIENILKSSRDDYLFIGGHYPVYSIAEHGPTQCLVKSLEPMLHKYNVTAYLNGHDHNLQHIRYTNPLYKSTVDYLTIGAANFIDISTKHKHDVPKHSLKFHWADLRYFGGFAGIELSAKVGVVTFFQANGTVLYQTQFYPRPIRRNRGI